MRLNARTVLFGLSALTIVCVLLIWSNCSNRELSNRVKRNCEALDVNPIACIINGNNNYIDCLFKNNEVYVPFTFLKNYFEIYGKIVETVDNIKTFHWSHSYSKIYRQIGKYNSRGVFTNFQNFKVEERDRVKCISASEGVPVSIQWNSYGYYYPTQIAQFGLSHYSKNIILPSPKVEILEYGQINPNWTVPATSKLTIVFNEQMNKNVLYFSSANEAISLNIDEKENFFISFNVAISLYTNIVIVIEETKTKHFWNLHYTCSQTFISAKGHNIYYGMHCTDDFMWKKLVRNLLTDLQKGLNLLKKPKKVFRLKYKLRNFNLYGVGYLDNLTLSSSNHISQFYNAADWFVRNQDKISGGWHNPVTRKISPFIKPLKPGWLSAMGQGQGISLLSRAFYHSGGNESYLNTAGAALKPFKVLSKNGGVLSKFMNLHPWYEEYPTVPSIFILNGFMYSLIGLYDLFSLAPNNSQVSREAYSLWKQGMTSLKSMLPLFDMGSRSAYDLRHVALSIAPNIARWDYHATHINQLLLLATLDNTTVFHTTARRWINYMNGFHSSHN